MDPSGREIVQSWATSLAVGGAWLFPGRFLLGWYRCLQSFLNQSTYRFRARADPIPESEIFDPGEKHVTMSHERDNRKCLEIPDPATDGLPTHSLAWPRPSLTGGRGSQTGGGNRSPFFYCHAKPESGTGAGQNDISQEKRGSPIRQNPFNFNWLGDVDSNHDSRSQSPLSYH